MSQMLEMPDVLYAALQKTAETNGMSPVAWIAAHLAATNAPAQDGEDVASPPRTLAQLFVGRVGRIGSGGKEHLSENGGAKLTDYLEAKKRAGCL